MHMVNQDYMDKELCQSLLKIIHIQVEQVTYIKAQHQYMDQIINLI